MFEMLIRLLTVVLLAVIEPCLTVKVNVARDVFAAVEVAVVSRV